MHQATKEATTKTIKQAIKTRLLQKDNAFKKIAFLTLITALLILALMQIKSVQANHIRDIPLTLHVSVQTTPLSDIKHYPSLFGTRETSSAQLSPFTKWSNMFERFYEQTSNQPNAPELKTLQRALIPLQNKSLYDQAKAVNKIINQTRYVTDNRNWRTSDYWATPLEFLQRGGDCEDFAITKYTALRMLGVPESRLRLAIVEDTWKQIAHAVLVVYTAQGPMILDNQNKQMQSAATFNRYRPIFSINRQAWWLHSDPSVTQIAQR